MPLRNGQGTQNNFGYVSEHFKTNIFFRKNIFFVERVLQKFSKIVRKKIENRLKRTQFFFLNQTKKKLENVFIRFLKNKSAVSQRRICRPPPPPQKWPHQKVIVNGAQCSESNGKSNKKILRFLFFELLRNFIENWGDDVTKMTLKWP